MTVVTGHRPCQCPPPWGRSPDRRGYLRPRDDVEEVACEFYDLVTLIDAGENTTRVTPAVDRDRGHVGAGDKAATV
jgi:hypothetical protein